MPLVLDPATLPIDRLRELFAEQRSGIPEIRERVASIPDASRLDPASYRTVEDLLADAETLLGHIDPTTSDAATLAAATNLAYSVVLSAIDLMKTHSDMPTRVPQGPRRSA